MLLPTEREFFLELVRGDRDLNLGPTWIQAFQEDPTLLQEAMQSAVTAGHTKTAVWLSKQAMCTQDIKFQAICQAIESAQLIMALMLLGQPTPSVLLQKVMGWAAAQGHTLWVYSLLNNANCTPQMQVKTLNTAVNAGHFEIVEAILIHGRQPNAETYLLAVTNNHREILKRLLQVNKVTAGTIKIHLMLTALKRENVEIVQDLIQTYPGVLDQIVLALLNGRYKQYYDCVITYFQDHVPASEWQKMIQRFLQKHHIDITAMLEKARDIAAFKAIEAGDLSALINITQKEPAMLTDLRSPLLLRAIRSQQKEIAFFLVVPGSILSMSVFLEAIATKQTEILRRLLDNSQKIEESMLFCFLTLAVEHENIEGVRVLIEYGTPVEKTVGPLILMAIQKNNVAVLDCLIATGQWVSQNPVDNYHFLKHLYRVSTTSETQQYAIALASQFGFSATDLTEDAMPLPQAHVSAMAEKMRLLCFQSELKKARNVLAEDSESAMNVGETQRARDHFDRVIKTDFELNAKFALKGGLESIEREMRTGFLSKLEEQILECSKDFDYREVLYYIESLREDLLKGAPIVREHFRDLICEYHLQGLRAAMAFHAYDETAWSALTDEEEIEGKFENLFVPVDPSVANLTVYAPEESLGEHAGALSLAGASHEIRTMTAYYYLIAEAHDKVDALINNIAECLCAHSDAMDVDDDCSCFPGYVRRLANTALGTPYGVPLTPVEAIHQRLTQKVLPILSEKFKTLAPDQRAALYDALLFVHPTDCREIFLNQFYLPSGAEVSAPYLRQLIAIRRQFLEEISGKKQLEKNIEYGLIAYWEEHGSYADAEAAILWLAEECFLLSLDKLSSDITALYRQAITEAEDEPIDVIAHTPESLSAFLARHQALLPQEPEQRMRMLARLEAQFLARQETLPGPTVSAVQFSRVSPITSPVLEVEQEISGRKAPVRQQSPV